MLVPLFGLGQQGKSPTVTAQRHLNLFAEISKDAEKSQVSFFGTPGCSLFTSFGDTPIRGWIPVNSLFYAVHRGTLWEVDNSGTKTSRGTLNTTTNKVSMSWDGATLVIVDGTNGYTYKPATTTFAQIVAAGFPNGAATVTWLDGQFVVDTGVSDSFYISVDGTTWNALDFATAESSPDGLVRVFTANSTLILAGTGTTEFWGNIGGADFPFTAIKGATIEYGLAAKWSMTKFGNGIMFLAKNAQGQVQVARLDDYTPTIVSTQEIDSIFNGYSTVSDATAMAYMDRGHPMYQINFPSVGKSWMYDGSTGMWSPRESGLSGGRQIYELHMDYLNKARFADYSSGNVYTMDSTLYTENGTQIAREIIGRHFYNDFNRIVVDELRLDFETGVGLISGQGSDPQVMLQISKDNGHTFGNELWTSIGAIGSYLTRAVWRRLGIGRDWVFKIRMTDPVKFVLTAAFIRVQDVGS